MNRKQTAEQKLQAQIDKLNKELEENRLLLEDDSNTDEIAAVLRNRAFVGDIAKLLETTNKQLESATPTASVTGGTRCGKRTGARTTAARIRTAACTVKPRALTMPRLLLGRTEPAIMIQTWELFGNNFVI